MGKTDTYKQILTIGNTLTLYPGTSDKKSRIFATFSLLSNSINIVVLGSVLNYYLCGYDMTYM